ncbi:MAG: CZB domain-containing protein [Pelagimonas sp.]|jgi:hypothetical protein|nr:CZB domain-containing protein [Pelagimonas sp.]
MNIHDLEHNIDEAIRAHGAWKDKLRSAVETGVLPKPAKEIACDNQCGFGKWLHGLKMDSSVAGSAQYQGVVAAHAAFHRAAGGVAALVEAGDRKAADKALRGAAFADTTSRLVDKALDWKRVSRS